MTSKVSIEDVTHEKKNPKKTKKKSSKNESTMDTKHTTPVKVDEKSFYGVPVTAFHHTLSNLNVVMFALKMATDSCVLQFYVSTKRKEFSIEKLAVPSKEEGKEQSIRCRIMSPRPRMADGTNDFTKYPYRAEFGKILEKWIPLATKYNHSQPDIPIDRVTWSYMFWTYEEMHAHFINLANHNTAIAKKNQPIVKTLAQLAPAQFIIKQKSSVAANASDGTSSAGNVSVKQLSHPEIILQTSNGIIKLQNDAKQRIDKALTSGRFDDLRMSSSVKQCGLKAEELIRLRYQLLANYEPDWSLGSIADSGYIYSQWTGNMAEVLELDHIANKGYVWFISTEDSKAKGKEKKEPQAVLFEFMHFLHHRAYECAAPGCDRIATRMKKGGQATHWYCSPECKAVPTNHICKKLEHEENARQLKASANSKALAALVRVAVPAITVGLPLWQATDIVSSIDPMDELSKMLGNAKISSVDVKGMPPPPIATTAVASGTASTPASAPAPTTTAKSNVTSNSGTAAPPPPLPITGASLYGAAQPTSVSMTD